MPYIAPLRRRQLDVRLDQLIDQLLDMGSQPGDVNYVITRMLKRMYWQSYRDINTALGILQAVGYEYYRRVAVPYEVNKIEVNGDVY